MKWVEGHVCFFYTLMWLSPSAWFLPIESIRLFLGGHCLFYFIYLFFYLPQDKVRKIALVPVWENLPMGKSACSRMILVSVYLLVHSHSLTHWHIHSLTLTHPLIYYPLTHSLLTHSVIHSNSPFLPPSRIVFLLFCVDIVLDQTLWVFSCLGQTVSWVILI